MNVFLVDWNINSDNIGLPVINAAEQPLYLNFSKH
jgi:hypothetical protein